MLLDINSYIGHWPFKQLKYNTCASRLETMNRFGVDLSVVSNLNGIFYKNTQSANVELYNELKSDKQFSSRFIPFAVINPIYAGWMDDLENCITKLGIKGVRVYPQYHDYSITDPGFIQLVKVCRDRGLPVTIDMRMVDSRQRSWMDIPVFDYNAPVKTDIIFREWNLQNIMPVIREVPDARFIIVNLANSIRLNIEDLALIRKADVVFDTSGRSLMGDDTLSELLKRFGSEKFAFGSHSPILDYLTGLLRIESMNGSEADDETKEHLRSGNARRIIGI
ncbi:MAG: amidohydrolase family protein [Bacteroidales bacterium]|nr:amidohydrolase family protein [Bacteroidales bacterium]